jgi:hypothetical protein
MIVGVITTLKSEDSFVTDSTVPNPTVLKSSVATSSRSLVSACNVDVGASLRVYARALIYISALVYAAPPARIKL